MVNEEVLTAYFQQDDATAHTTRKSEIFWWQMTPIRNLKDLKNGVTEKCEVINNLLQMLHKVFDGWRVGLCLNENGEHFQQLP